MRGPPLDQEQLGALWAHPHKRAKNGRTQGLALEVDRPTRSNQDGRVSETRSGVPPAYSKPRIVVAHSTDSRPVTAVKNMLIQASLGQIQNAGFYERYSKLIEPQVL